jgi:cell division protein FtsW (lipid II flippase)
MSERWKYQLKMGGFWGVFMVVFMTLLELKEKSVSQQLSDNNFYVRAVSYIVIGIFVLGYFSWKEKVKRENSAKK